MNELEFYANDWFNASDAGVDYQVSTTGVAHGTGQVLACSGNVILEGQQRRSRGNQDYSHQQGEAPFGPMLSRFRVVSSQHDYSFPADFVPFFLVVPSFFVKITNKMK